MIHEIILSDRMGNTSLVIPINNAKNELMLVLDVPAGFYLLRAKRDSGTFQAHSIAVVQ